MMRAGTAAAPRLQSNRVRSLLDISRGSALETKALLKKGLAVGYWTAEEFQRLDKLADRGLQAVAKFQRYLRSPAAKHNAAQRYRKP